MCPNLPDVRIYPTLPYHIVTAIREFIGKCFGIVESIFCLYFRDADRKHEDAHSEYQTKQNTTPPDVNLCDINPTYIGRLKPHLQGDKVHKQSKLALDIFPDGRIVLTDTLFHSIHVFTGEFELQASLTLPNYLYPNDVAVINNTRIVVSIWNAHTLYIFGTEDERIVQRRKIKTTFYVRGVSVYEDKLFIGCLDARVHQASIKVIDLTGKAYWSRDYDDYTIGYHYFNTMFLENDKLVCLFTDFWNKNLVKVNGDTGESICVTKLNGNGPTALTFDAKGLLYLACDRSREIYAIKLDLSEQRVILRNEENLEDEAPGDRPWCVKYDNVRQRLFVSYYSMSGTSNYVECYKI